MSDLRLDDNLVAGRRLEGGLNQAAKDKRSPVEGEIKDVRDDPHGEEVHPSLSVSVEMYKVMGLRLSCRVMHLDEMTVSLLANCT